MTGRKVRIRRHYIDFVNGTDLRIYRSIKKLPGFSFFSTQYETRNFGCFLISNVVFWTNPTVIFKNLLPQCTKEKVGMVIYIGCHSTSYMLYNMWFVSVVGVTIGVLRLLWSKSHLTEKWLRDQYV